MTMAVLAPSLRSGLDYCTRNLLVSKIEQSRRKVTTVGGNVYYIVLDMEDTRGREFDSYLMTPDYRDPLVAAVESRVRAKRG